MKLIRQLNSLRRIRRPILLAAGFFDGLHRGHQRVISQALAARRRGLDEVWIMTFDPHPQKLLAPTSPTALLTSTAHKLHLFQELGVDGCVIIPFTQVYARQKPAAFIAALASAAPSLAQIFIGSNWTFGQRGQGNVKLLKSLAQKYGFGVNALAPLCWRGKPISSTRIRLALQAGRLAEAAQMLGRPFSMLGQVIPGQQIGRRLGFPTANLNPKNEAHPPAGIYMALARLGKQHHAGVVYLGLRPSIRQRGRKSIRLELHLFDIRRNLYGKTLEVFLLKRLRGDRKFASWSALSQQIQRDIIKAQSWFQGHQQALEKYQLPPLQ